MNLCNICYRICKIRIEDTIENKFIECISCDGFVKNFEERYNRKYRKVD